jgi:hypothetical protein
VEPQLSQYLLISMNVYIINGYCIAIAVLIQVGLCIVVWCVSL